MRLTTSTNNLARELSCERPSGRKLGRALIGVRQRHNVLPHVNTFWRLVIKQRQCVGGNFQIDDRQGGLEYMPMKEARNDSAWLSVAIRRFW